MAHFRYTINELLKKDSGEYLDDKSLILALIHERQSSVTNVNSPLYVRLNELEKKVENEEIFKSIKK